MLKRAFLSMCILLLLACVVQAAAMRKGPYLFYPGENTEMTVLWQLHGPDPVVCTLEWGLDETYGSVITSNEYGDDHQHKHTIDNLVPGSKYYYQVTAGEDEYVGTFFAAPDDSAETLKFLAYGDTRTYPTDHNKVCSKMVDAFVADEGYQTFTLLSGDFVGSGTSEEDWDIEYFGGVGPGYYYDDDGNDVDPNYYWDTSSMLANLPINACVGNHEALSQTLFPKYWPYPFVEGFYWSFEYGPALFVVIDQYRSARLTDKGPKAHNQLPWLENTLKKSDKEWKFIVLHEPGYSAGGGHDDDVDVQELVQPLCLEYGVDIVFGGHNHYYARCVADGVQHLTLGGGGAPLREPEPDYSEYVVYCEMVHHFGKVAIDGNILSFEAISADDGSVIDSFTISHASP
ncbi:MAG: metallophosphoesterase family protein [Planctomycetota bacterium]|nr:MAG: metallophosphoesterase family protein [Planctomycetota bacterium]